MFMRVARRITDILLSTVGIIFLIPLGSVIALLIKLDSKGPVFYLADRVGKDMKKFKMYKFRTMMETSACTGDNVCPQYDPRVTTFGRFLRRTKMNEIPQLINILCGDMCFVGPRPEAPVLAELYPEDAKKIFSVKPGLVSPATILGRNEEELYPPGVDAEKYYIDKILPKKVSIDLEYINTPAYLKDLKYILMGIKVTLTGALKRKHIHDNRSQIYLLLADTLIILCSYFMAIFIWSAHYPYYSAARNPVALFSILSLVTVVTLLFGIYFGIYSCLIRYISYHEVLCVLKGMTSASVFLLMVAWMLDLDYYPKMIVAINWPILIIALSGFRLCLKLYWNFLNSKCDIKEKHNIFIFGANETGISAYNAICSDKSSHFNVVGFIDESPNKYGKRLHGIKVLGNRHHIKELAALYKVEGIILTKYNHNNGEFSEVVKICQKLGLKYWVFSLFKDIGNISQLALPIRNLKFTDLLPNERIHVDYSSVKNILKDKIVLFNGTGGSLGMELCSQILQFGCKKLIVIDRYESYLSELLASIANESTYDSIIPVISEINGKDSLLEIFENYHPEIVIHANTRKYTPFLAFNTDNVWENNYVSTFKLAKMASKFNSDVFLMISSLNAAQNGSLVTDTLRIAEVSLKHFFNDSETRLIIARICDIIENRGGLVSVIENQIRNQETLNLPLIDFQISLMSKCSATAFILQCLAEASETEPEGRIFNCKPTFTGTVREIAINIAKLYGLVFGVDLPVEYKSFDREQDKFALKELSSPTCSYSDAVTSYNSKRCFTENEGKSVLKNFVIDENNKRSHQDWGIITQELIKLCPPDTLMGES